MSMKQYADPYGLAFTASAPDSVETISRFTTSYMGFRRETGAILKDLTESDPDMPMARCAKGYLAKLMGSSNHSARAVSISKDLDAHLEKVGANDREKLHAAALAAWCRGDLDKTTSIWEEILLDHPMDGLVLRLAHFTHFYSGDGRKMRDSMARHLPLWPKDHPNYGFLLGMYAFGLEESGQFEKAEHYGRAAVERNPKDAWSVHSIAHVMEMTERQEEGIAWIAGLESDWSTVNNFRFHLYWHKCLFHLERGEFDQVLKLYDEQISSDVESDFYLDICNCSSLLWRLEMFGVNVGDRWRALTDVARKHLHDRDLIFVSLHYLMALVANGDRKAADQMIESMREWAQLDETQARICATVGLAVAKGLQLSRDGKYAEAVAAIKPVRYDLDLVGGSKAQRDVFIMIMLDAAKASNDALVARALFSERLGEKVHSSWTWKNYSTILESSGKSEEAAFAAGKAQEIRVS
ncbi:tetratricopeptide repeat protein [Sulfitobacter porphyrae]|uniref:Tetratricopeptide repeat protein 38 n=1 Tax=Sulfitobacter porphyrae TaxID=1246864 RepID=A0ABW2BAT7_9RHOB|nr:tetratricopeptide repeat protein 38 family protein [Sulfitobacter porphyrae]